MRLSTLGKSLKDLIIIEASLFHLLSGTAKQALPKSSKLCHALMVGGAFKIVEPSFTFFRRSVSFPAACGRAALGICVSVLVPVALIASKRLSDEMKSVGVGSGA